MSNLKNFQIKLSDLYKYVQMDDKPTKNAKIKEITHVQSRYL